MPRRPDRLRRATALLTLLLASPSLLFPASVNPNPKKTEEEENVVTLTPFEVSGGPQLGYSAASTLAGTRLGTHLGATPGGAQDINFFRMGAGAGQVPHPDTITAEGLFSEHDLPLDLGDRSAALFRVQTAAAAAQFEALPRVRYLAQLGLSSGLRADQWQRMPLNLVAVVDKSGSMSGEPLALVRAGLLSALKYLRDGDQLSIILYGDRSHVHLPTTTVSRARRREIERQIKAIESAGSTNMEEGLRLGYEVARQSAAAFTGNTRVILFTDERPNVGNTEAEGFMAMAETASRAGIGLTTIGVGVQFGADLATRISSVRGGNLFFFPNAAEMTKTFADDFDTMVTELAHAFSVRIAPAPGFRLEGVFGLPADILRWDGNAIVMDVATIFLSKRKGAIYFALAPDTANPDLPARQAEIGDTLADVSLSYENALDGQPAHGVAPCRLIQPGTAQAGLTRGTHLVDEYLTLKKAAQAHVLENNQEAAFRLLGGLLNRLAGAGDPTLAPEVELARNVHNTLALLSGHAGEVQAANPRHPVSPLVGVWRHAASSPVDHDQFLIVWANGVLEHLDVDPANRFVAARVTVALDGPLPAGRRGTLPLAAQDRRTFPLSRYEFIGGTLLLKTPGFGDARQTLAFTSCRYSDIPLTRLPTALFSPRDDAEEEVVELSNCIFGPADIDPLSGLPANH